MNNHIVRIDDTVFKFYYSQDKNIYVRTYEDNRLKAPQTVLSNALPDFSVSIKNNRPEVFARDEKGNIIISSYENNQFTNRIMLENKADQIHKILFASMQSNANSTLIYNIPEGQKYYKLMMQKIGEAGKWERPIEIDLFQPYKDDLFLAYPLGLDHSLICYVDANNNLGYREVTPDKTGAFHILANISENIFDYSILASKEGIHFIYITGNIFSFRLMYRRKTETEFTKPLILWEGNRIESCLLWISENKLNASFMSNNKLHVQNSTNNGQSFYQPEIYRNKFCLRPAKAAYISNKKLDPADFYVYQLYVDAYNPWDVQIFPDISSNFYPEKEITVPEPPPSVDAASEELSSLNNNEMQPNSMHDILSEKLNAISTENQELRYNQAKLKDEIEEKNKQLSDLTVKANAEKHRYEVIVQELKNTISLLENANKTLETKAESPIAISQSNTSGEKEQTEENIQLPPENVPESNAETPSEIEISENTAEDTEK